MSVASALVGCGIEREVDVWNPESGQLLLDLGPNGLSLAVGETVQIEGTPTFVDGSPVTGLYTMTWRSSNDAVVTVNRGELRARSVGTAEIQATAQLVANGASATDSVSVTVRAASDNPPAGDPPADETPTDDPATPGVCLSITAAGGAVYEGAALANQAGSYEVIFSATPKAAGINAAVAMAAGPSSALDWTDLAVIVRFNAGGTIDVRDGATYSASSSLQYTAGVAYRLRLLVDVPRHRYSVFASLAGGAEQTLATAFAFRSEQQSIASIGQWGLRAESGALDACLVALTPDGGAPPPSDPVPTCPPGTIDVNGDGSVCEPPAATDPPVIPDPPLAGETADKIFLWGTAQTAQDNFFLPAIWDLGYGLSINIHNDQFQRFPGQSSVDYHIEYTEQSIGERVELGAREEYQALGVAVGSTVWIGWSQMYSHIGLNDPFTDFQIRSQGDGITGSPAAEFEIDGSNNAMSFSLDSVRREHLLTIEEGTWYDFVLEFKYSYDNDGYVRIWAAAAGSNGEVRLSHSSPTAEIIGMPTMHNGTTFINRWADSAEHRAMKDTSPHLRWGVYTWAASAPEAVGEYYRKFLGTVRMEVGSNLGQAGFAAVLPRTTVSALPSPRSLAIGAKAKASSDYDIADGVFAVDGRTFDGDGKAWQGIVYTRQEAQPYLDIDLRAATTINKIVVWNIASALSRLNGLAVMVSAQPFNCSGVTACRAQAGVWSTALTTAQLKNELVVPGISGRYLRLQLPGTQILSLAEVEVF